MSICNMKRWHEKLRMGRLLLFALVPLFFLSMQQFACTNNSDDLGELNRRAERDLFIELDSIAGPDEYIWKKKIDNTQQAINTIISSYMQVNKFYNELTRHFILREMFGPALSMAQEALLITPNDARLHYAAGLSAANLSKVPNTGQRDFYLDMAERYYLSALNLEPRNPEILYAAAVFHTFEREDLAGGKVYCERLLAVRSADIRGRFLLARILVGEGNIQEAITQYQNLRNADNITDTQKQTVEDNIRELEGRAANVQ